MRNNTLSKSGDFEIVIAHGRIQSKLERERLVVLPYRPNSTGFVYTPETKESQDVAGMYTTAAAPYASTNVYPRPGWCA